MNITLRDGFLGLTTIEVVPRLSAPRSATAGVPGHDDDWHTTSSP